MAYKWMATSFVLRVTTRVRNCFEVILMVRAYMIRMEFWLWGTLAPNKLMTLATRKEMWFRFTISSYHEHVAFESGEKPPTPRFVFLRLTFVELI